METNITFPQRYSGALCIASSSLSIVGALTLFVCYLQMKSGSQAVTSRTLVMCIAFSDFFTAAGYLVMASFYANSGVLGETQNLATVFANHSTLVRLCAGQSFVTTTSSMWSFWWTAILAFHLNLGFVWHKWAWCRRLLPLYCTCAWTIPLILTIPALATGWLGLGCGQVSVTWCFVGVKNLNEGCHGVTQSVLEAVEGKMWEVSAFVLISGFYLHIWCQLVYSRQKVSDLVWRVNAPPLSLNAPPLSICPPILPHCPAPSLCPTLVYYNFPSTSSPRGVTQKVPHCKRSTHRRPKTGQSCSYQLSFC